MGSTVSGFQKRIFEIKNLSEKHDIVPGKLTEQRDMAYLRSM